jgi:hypothetical protein
VGAIFSHNITTTSRADSVGAGINGCSDGNDEGTESLGAISGNDDGAGSRSAVTEVIICR